jgi:hypothetical protein
MVKASFRDISYYPFYGGSDKTWWGKTKHIDAPWGEIRTETTIFTVPTPRLLSIQDLGTFSSNVDKAVLCLLDFLGARMSGELYRGIVDVDVTDKEPLAGEPVVLLLEEFNDIVSNVPGGQGFLKFLTNLGFSLIAGKFCEKEIELGVARLAACYALRSIWPRYDIFKLCGEKVGLAHELWPLVEMGGAAAFRGAIQSVVTDNDLQELANAWVIFVQGLEKSLGQNLKEMRERYTAGRTVATNEGQELNAFLLNDEGE